MAKWSVALFGHEKPKVDGWEKRAKPGDIIACRPIEEAGRWTPIEHKEFLIVEIDGFEPEQLAALTEPLWDTNSIPAVPDEVMQELIAKNKTIELRPTKYLFKRRFSIPIADLEAAGVDSSAMLNKELEYKAKIKTFAKTDIHDKLNQAYVKTDAGMNLIKPLIAGKVL